MKKSIALGMIITALLLAGCVSLFVINLPASDIDDCFNALGKTPPQGFRSVDGDSGHYSNKGERSLEDDGYKFLITKDRITVASCVRTRGNNTTYTDQAVKIFRKYLEDNKWTLVKNDDADPMIVSEIYQKDGVYARLLPSQLLPSPKHAVSTGGSSTTQYFSSILFAETLDYTVRDFQDFAEW
jgi:hypothetical protein